MAANRTIKGKAIPENMEHLVPAGITDQAIDERNAQPQRIKGVGRVVRDEAFERKLERMEREVEMGADPFKEVLEECRENDPDLKFRYLSDSVVRKRGLRGWEAYHDAKGELVKVAGMTLAAMPIEIAELRDEKYRRMGGEHLQEAKDNLAESQTRLISEARAVGLSPLTSGDRQSDSSEPGRTASIGIHHTRG